MGEAYQQARAFRIGIKGLAGGLLLATAAGLSSLALGKGEPGPADTPQAVQTETDLPGFFLARRRNPLPGKPQELSIPKLQEALKSPDPKVREEAAAKLRPIYLPPPRDEWKGLLARLPAGLSREQLKAVLSEVNATAEDSIDEIEDYRLDERWVLRCVMTSESQNLASADLVEKVKTIWIKPAEDFTGEWNTFYVNGQISHHIQYKDGKYNGLFIVHYPSGQRLFVQHYKMHVAHGSDVGYFRSGNVQYTALYHEGKQAGYWRFYNEDGSLRTTQTHPLPPADSDAVGSEKAKRRGELTARFIFSDSHATKRIEPGDQTGTPLKDVVIWRQVIPASYNDEWPREVFEEPVKMIFRGGKLTPSVLAYDARQVIRFINEDEVPTNIVWNPLAGNSFNRLLKAGESFEYKLAPQRIPYPLQSNLHPNQGVFLFPCPHDCFATSDENGKFHLKHLQTGKWEFRLWHPEHGYLKCEKDIGRKFFADIEEGVVDLGDLIVTPLKPVQATEGKPLTDAPPKPALDYTQLRSDRVKQNDRGSGSEFTGEWTMRLPRGFEYRVKLEQREDGLLVMKSQNNLTLLGTFACQKNRLQLVETRESNINDFTWDFRDGVFVLVDEDLHNGANYVGATLTRVKNP